MPEPVSEAVAMGAVTVAEANVGAESVDDSTPRYLIDGRWVYITPGYWPLDAAPPEA